MRKTVEYSMVTKYDTKDTGDGQYWYLLDVDWVARWKKYVKSDNVRDVADMIHPGRIENERLLRK